MEQNIDNSNSKKRSLRLWIILLIIGAVLIAGGMVCYHFFGINSKAEREDINLEFNSEGITNLEFESGISEFNIKASSTDKIIVEGENVPKGRYTVNNNDTDTLKIEYNERKWFNLFDFGYWDKDKPIGTVTVYLPVKIYNELDFSGGVGINNISDIKVINLEFDGGVGENNLTNVTASGNSDLDFGVGKTTMKNCSLSGSEIDVGVGEFYYSGKINGNTSVNSGVGSVTMDIDGYKNEYKITTDKGVGEINISGSETDYVSNSTKSLELDSGVGEMNINFK
ncbi:MAG: hypothetical protein ACI4I7_05640 [Oscillospiraceae bacterium]